MPGCEWNRSCELQKLAEEMGIRDRRYEGERNHWEADDSSQAVV